jgi:tetratricopeptide (TPR) repeat protein
MPLPEPLVLDEEALALKRRRRERGYWIFFAIFSLPVLIGVWLVFKTQRAIAREQDWAQAQLASARPDPRAYGVRGAGLLVQGDVAGALPLLRRAAEHEKQAGPRAGVQATVLLVEAHLDGLKRQVAGASRAEALALLKDVEARAAALPPGPQAAAWHAAGKLYGHLERQDDALRCLRKAVELQPDDWYVGWDGYKLKHRGIASIYQKDLAGAQRQ